MGNECVINARMEMKLKKPQNAVLKQNKKRIPVGMEQGAEESQD